MISYLIVEDERLLAGRLERLIGHLRPSYECVEAKVSVEETTEYLRSNSVDLIFMDIELADGDCFDIFRELELDTPVIFTTAYDQHAIKAFKVNSVDYLLKPVEEQPLLAAIEKFEKNTPLSTVYSRQNRRSMRERLIINKGNNFLYVNVNNIAYFMSSEKYTSLYTFEGNEHLSDKALWQLENELDKRIFFRVARNCIVNINAIATIHKFINGRLKLTVNPACEFEVIVSQARRDDFLKWIDGEVTG